MLLELTILPIAQAAVALHGWIFPGAPACSAPDIISQYGIDSVNVEYLTVGNANLVQLNEATSGCNAYSAKFVLLT